MLSSKTNPDKLCCCLNSFWKQPLNALWLRFKHHQHLCPEPCPNPAQLPAAEDISLDRLGYMFLPKTNQSKRTMLLPQFISEGFLDSRTWLLHPALHTTNTVEGHPESSSVPNLVPTQLQNTSPSIVYKTVQTLNRSRHTMLLPQFNPCLNTFPRSPHAHTHINLPFLPRFRPSWYPK